MTNLRDAARVMMVGFDGTEPSESLRTFVSESPPCGVILFGRNITSTSQVARLTRQLRELWPATEPPPLIAIDQEGGNVRRLKAPECPDFAQFPSMRAVGRSRHEETSFRVGEITARQLAALGFNLNFAPVLDVDTNPENPIINQRAFARDPEWVAKLGIACAQGLHAGGVLSCGKHFPGHGDTSIDSHLGLPSLPHSRERLDAVELRPFRAAVKAELPCLMSAHIVFEDLDPELPATLSPTVIPTLLRQEMGFEGVLFSDDLEMAAIGEHFEWSDIARRGLLASIDVFLVCRDLNGARTLRDALVQTTNESRAHKLAFEESLRRNDKVRTEAKDHASVPYSGRLPEQDSAKVLVDELLRAN